MRTVVAAVALVVARRARPAPSPIVTDRAVPSPARSLAPPPAMRLRAQAGMR
jgi:hypothetical protein